MKACDVVGYVCEGDTYCSDCAVDPTEEDGAIFADTEFDSPHHCSHCGRPIRHSLTREGETYVRAIVLASYRRGRRGNEAIRANGPTYYAGCAGGTIALDWLATYGVRLTGWASRASTTLASHARL